MKTERILSLLKQKESGKLEFKEANHHVPSSLFETVCAFLNRDGGDILLGITNSGEIIGIDEPVIEKMMKEITNNSNNPQVLDPPFLLFPEKINIQDKWILYIQVPASSSVVRYKGTVYDRAVDGDFKIKEPDRIAALSNRKKGFYSETRVYQYLELSDLDDATIKKTRNRISSKNPEHPWLPLSNEEMLMRAGLIKKDIDSGIRGLTLAAALLFGKDETIQAIIPQYKIDILVKRQDLSRYDDRLDIRSNLMEAYPAIMTFLGRHLPDPFYMEKDIRLSLREKIFREAVANILVHREYLSQYPARIIIYSDHVEFSNPCNPVFKGNISESNLYSNQKNPILSKIFLQLGWVEEVGTGIHNINKYLPFYTPGKNATFYEDDIFKTIIPIPFQEDLRIDDIKNLTLHDEDKTEHDTMHDTGHDTLHDVELKTLHDMELKTLHDMELKTHHDEDKTEHDTVHDTGHDTHHDVELKTLHDAESKTLHDTPKIIRLLKIMQKEKEVPREYLLSKLDLNDRANLRNVYLKPALESGLIELTLPDKLKSKKQKYRITEKGKMFLKKRKK